MKIKRTVFVFGVKLLLMLGFILAGLLFLTPAALAAPRPSWVGLLPEASWPLYHETFDELLEIYPYGTTNAQVTVGNFTFDESWSGYALQRSGASVTPFYVPAVDSGYTNINCSKGMIRCWFEPTTWSSATQTNGTGPGAVAVLLELDAVGNNESANVWSLQVNADGTTLSLIAHSDDSPALLLQTNISWQAGQSHLIALDYSTNGTDLYVDGELVAQGASVPTVPPQLAALFVGSSLAGTSVAGGDFDELCCFGATGSRFYHPLTATDILFYYNALVAQAALGPVSAEEIATRAARIAALQAQREDELFLDDSGMEMMAMRGTYGAVADCLTNVPVYMTNVWAGFETNGTITVTFDVVGGTNGFIYDVLGTTNLSGGPWFFVTNTPTCNTVVITNQALTQTFYILRSTQDSDGSGMPDWWQLQHFGYTGVDPYADPDADGWNNLQEFENQTDPNGSNTPPKPKIVGAIYNAAASSYTVTWQATGPVNSFTVKDESGNVMGNTSSGNWTFTTNYSPDLTRPVIPPTRRVQANYSGGITTISDSVSLANPQLDLNPQFAFGAESQAYLNLDSIPANLAFVRVYAPPDDNPRTNYIYFDLSRTNFVNGAALISNTQMLETNYVIVLQAFATNGEFGDPATEYGPLLEAQADEIITFDPGSFIYAARHLKENLKFLLRSATVSTPFSYETGLRTGGGTDIYPGTDPGSYYGRPVSSTNYEYYGFHYYSPYLGFSFMEELRPVDENYLWRNFAFNTLDVTNGYFSTGANVDEDCDGAFIRTLDSMKYLYSGPGTETPLPVAFYSTNSLWLYVRKANVCTQAVVMADMGLNLYSDSPGVGISLNNNAHNIWGLGLDSARVHALSSGGGYVTLTPGGTGTHFDITPIFLEAEQPVLTTVAYYFASQTAAFQFAGTLFPPVPGSPDFTVTNTSPLLITGIGQRITVSAWAKQQITNGYTNKFAYLEQYFDKAYTIGTNGIATTNSAGIVSPYGEFFPTMSGSIALVTMPDIDTGQRGTGVVQVIKLQLDVNHDGDMDLGVTGPDNTSPAKPFLFWVNNDYEPYNEDIKLAGARDCDDGVISCARDLEDFARLWLRGLPALPSSQGYSINLSWQNTNGTPKIKIYPAAESNGGIGYLTNGSVALSQLTILVGQISSGQTLGEVSPAQSLTFPTDYFAEAGTKHFLFEGSGVGSGQLVMTITQGTNVIAQTSAWLDLRDVKDLYEHAYTENVPRPHEVPPSSLISTCVVDNVTRTLPDEAKQVIVFVHGMNETEFSARKNADTFFKRLYWAGYHGKVAAFRWQCDYLPFENTFNPFNYNLSEFYAWKSAPAFKDYLSYLTNRNDLAGYTINILAHSQGNIVVSEALKQGAPFDNYILSQAAVPAHCYDTNVPFLQKLLDAETDVPTPFYTTNGGYHGYFADLPGNIINFFNTNDFALAKGTYTVPIIGTTLQTNWEEDQRTQKPESFAWRGLQEYSYDSSSKISYRNFPDNISFQANDPQEVKPMVARGRSRAIGAEDNAAEAISTSVDLRTSFGFDSTRDEHSAQFSRNIQGVIGYYQAILVNIAP